MPQSTQRNIDIKVKAYDEATGVMHGIAEQAERLKQSFCFALLRGTYV